MSTITKERVAQYANDPRMCNVNDEIRQIARIALASLEAEPVAWLLEGGGAKNAVSFDSGNAYADPLRDVTPLYTAPPAPIEAEPVANEIVIPETATHRNINEICPPGVNQTLFASGWNASRKSGMNSGRIPPIVKGIDAECMGWNACRDAMLQGADGNSPVIPERWENCKHLLPIGELIHRLQEQTGDKWIRVRDVISGDLISAMEEVLRISDRDHDAWHRARAAIAKCREVMS